MFAGLLEVVPFFWALPILAGFLLLLMFIMILTAGYRVRLPLFLGEIGPAAVEDRNNVANNLALEQEIKNLRKMLGNMTLQNQAIESTSGSNSNNSSSGIEEIKPLGYDCKSGSHSAVDEADSAQASATQLALTLTPSRRRNREVLLTPVKARVMSQPDIFQRPSDPLQREDQEDIVDLSMPFKRSDSFPKSPQKSLSVQSCHDVKNTTFEWITSDEGPRDKGTEDDNPNPAPTIPPSLHFSDNKIDYLTKVEEIFDSTADL